jgi:hypothetical protein
VQIHNKDLKQIFFSNKSMGSNPAWASSRSVGDNLRVPLIARVASLCSLPNSLSALTEPEFFFLPTALKGEVYQTSRPYVILGMATVMYNLLMNLIERPCDGLVRHL